MMFQMSDDELEAFVKLVDDNGEISKNDIIIQVKNIYICGTGWPAIIFKAVLKMCLKFLNFIKRRMCLCSDEAIKFLEREPRPQKCAWKPLYKGERQKISVELLFIFTV